MSGAVGIRFFFYHGVLPLLALFVLWWLFMFSGGDHWVATKIYQIQGGRWALMEHWTTSGIVHGGGKKLSTGLMLGVLAALMLFKFGRSEKNRQWIVPLFYLASSGLLSVIVVSALKSITNMDCPWSLLQYGGEKEFFGLFDNRPWNVEPGKCFPAGHASAGYAWVGLYFFFMLTYRDYRWIGLAAGIGSGIIFGLTQQIRGAHFMSHDIATLAICWGIALLLYVLLRGKSNFLVQS